MKIFIRRALAILASALVLTMGAQLAPLPAQAAALHGCADDSVCLYANLNYGYDRWQSSLINLYNSPNGCINLTSPAAYWDNGTPVYDNSSGGVVNVTNWQGTWYVTFYDWVNCNTSGGLTSTGQFSIGDYDEPDWRTTPIGYGLVAYHRITSIGISYGSCPPGGC